MPDDCYAFYSAVTTLPLPEHKRYMPWRLQYFGCNASAEVVKWSEENAGNRNSDASFMMGFICLSRGDMKGAVRWFNLVDSEALPMVEYMLWFAKAAVLARCLDEAQVPQVGDIYVGGDMPQDKLINAMVSFGILLDDMVFAIIDSTIFGSCKEGAAFTLRGIYWKNFLSDRKFISWRDLSEKGWVISVENDEVNLHNGEVLSLAGARMMEGSFLRIINIIRGLEKYLM